MKKHPTRKEVVTIANAATVSSQFEMPSWATFAGIFLPSMDDGPVGIELSMDGSNFYPLLDPLDGQDLVIASSGADPGWIDVSDWIRFVPDQTSENVTMRLTCAAQTGAKTVYIFFKG